jgi:hypothetical protein
MSPENDIPRSLEEQLLEPPRRVAGIDSRRQPVRLGERDTDGHVVGYIDEDGLAWQSLAERIVAAVPAASSTRSSCTPTTRSATDSSSRRSPTCRTS